VVLLALCIESRRNQEAAVVRERESPRRKEGAGYRRIVTEARVSCAARAQPVRGARQDPPVDEKCIERSSLTLLSIPPFVLSNYRMRA